MFFQTFPKPERTSLVDKECIICFESLDNELDKIVELPCKCSNAVYHVDCIVRLLESGENKNLCPYCRAIFPNRNNNNNNNNPPQEVVRGPIPLDERKLAYIFIIHIFTNTLMNLISIGMLDDIYTNTIKNVVCKILIASFFSKVVFNAFLLFTLKYYRENLNSHISASYSLQTIIFVLLVCFLSSVRMNFRLGFLLANNLFFCIGDIFFRISIECCS
jgi:hypothetical protein